MADLLDAGISPRALRYALIAVHYRAANNWSDNSLAAATAALDRLDALVAALGAYESGGPDDRVPRGGPGRGGRARSVPRSMTT